MTVGYMPQTYYVQQQHQQPQQQRRGKPLPQIPVSSEPMFPRSVSPYYGSLAGFPPPQPLLFHHHHHPLPPPTAMASKGPSSCSSLIMPPPSSSIQSKRHSFSDQGMIRREMQHLIEPQQQKHGIKKRYSMDMNESNKIEQEEEEEMVPALSESTSCIMQKPFDPSYELGSNNNNKNNKQSKIFQTPNTPDNELEVSTSARSLSPSTTSPATPTCQTGTTPSKIPSPWGSMVSLALRDNNEEDGEPLPSPVTPLTTEPQPIVMEEQKSQKVVVDQVTPLSLPSSESTMERKRSLPPVPIENNNINKNEAPPTAIHVAVADLIQQKQKQKQPQLAQQLEQLEPDNEKKKNQSPPRFTCIVASYSLTHQKDAIKIYRRMAVKTKNSQVQLAYAKYLLDVARLYEENASTRQRLLKEGRYWISRLAKKKIWEAVFLHGQHYLEAHQPAKATRCFEKAAQHGYSDAYLALAEQAEEQKDWTKALACYRSAADGHPAANYKMAMVLLRQNMNPIQVLEKAAKAGKTIESGKAAFVLSNIYSHILKTRERVDKDEGKAYQYLKQAFQSDITEAVYRMGQVHTLGLLGQPKDAWQGYQCFMKSAEEGYDVAMLALSKVYAQGIQGYLSPQPEIAFRWCQRAAERGLKEAEFTLGTYYEVGVGTPIDYPRALEYFGKAASKGHGEAAGKLNRPVVKSSSLSSNKKLPLSSTSTTAKTTNTNTTTIVNHSTTVQRYQQQQDRCCIM